MVKVHDEGSQIKEEDDNKLGQSSLKKVYLFDNFFDSSSVDKKIRETEANYSN